MTGRAVGGWARDMRTGGGRSATRAAAHAAGDATPSARDSSFDS
jgi:hypothetical protein